MENNGCECSVTIQRCPLRGDGFVTFWGYYANKLIFRVDKSLLKFDKKKNEMNAWPHIRTAFKQWSKANGKERS